MCRTGGQLLADPRYDHPVGRAELGRNAFQGLPDDHIVRLWDYRLTAYRVDVERRKAAVDRQLQLAGGEPDRKYRTAYFRQSGSMPMLLFDGLPRWP